MQGRLESEFIQLLNINLESYMRPPTPCQATLPHNICQNPPNGGNYINPKLQTVDQGYMESSSSSCSPGPITPSDSCLPPTAPKVPKLHPSVPRSFARECSSSIGPGTSSTEKTMASTCESPSSVRLLRLPLDSEKEVKTKDAAKHSCGQGLEAGPFQRGYVDGLVALQQYTSSADESTSSTPYHVSSTASTYLIPSTPTRGTVDSASPDSDCSSRFLECPAGDTIKTSSEDPPKQTSKPYCPPHKRQPRLQPFDNEGPLSDTEVENSGGHGENSKRLPFSVNPSHVGPSRRAASPRGVLNGLGPEKGPFLRKLLSSSFQTTFPGEADSALTWASYNVQRHYPYCSRLHEWPQINKIYYAVGISI